MKRNTKGRVFALVTIGGVLAVAIGAFAYFSTTGSGTATATVGSSSALVIKGTVTGNLFPGSSSPVALTVDNNSGGKQRVGTITLEKITADAGHTYALVASKPTDESDPTCSTKAPCALQLATFPHLYPSSFKPGHA